MNEKNLAGKTANALTSLTEAIDQVCLKIWGAIAVVMAVLYTCVLGVVAVAVAPFKDGLLVDYIAKFWSKLILGTCGIRVELEGQDKLPVGNSCVIVANHQSVLDIFAFLAVFPLGLRFVAKKELRRIPLVGYAMERTGHILVDRERVGASIRHAIKLAKRGHPIVFFAEGHRYADNKVHPFNEGAAWLAILGQLPCIPVALSGSGNLFPPGAKVVRPGGRIKIRICDAVSTQGLKVEDRQNLTKQLEARVTEAFSSLLAN